ncbi:MAG: 2-methyl-6-phytyl-1,4-hydroquinone methyltransferase [Nitrosomonadaceae bacterium]|nr:2-methyl-6-phytyl-1,4-hydroquinone methyltransferase [Nitrosomonadaceae bacterium]
MRGLLLADKFLTRCINRLAIEYDGGVHVKHRLMRYHEFFVSRVKLGERVLDVGCGCGAVAYSLATQAGAFVTGIDLSKDNILKAQARFKHPNLSFVHGDARTSLPSGAWDVVVLSNILEHLEHRVSFLADVQRCINPSRILVRLPMIDRDWRVPLRKELGLYYFNDPTHYTEYTRESFEQEMGEAGLTIRHIQYNWGELWAEVLKRG